MWRLTFSCALLSIAGALAGCGDGQPFRFDAEEPVPEPPDPDDPTPEQTVQGNLTSSTYDPVNDALTVFIRSLDSTPRDVAYSRNPDLEAGVGSTYRAYFVQEDALDRFFTAFAHRTAGVEGVLVMDGGQFNRYFGGVNTRQVGPYRPYAPSQPDRGLVSYAGDYVGMLNAAAPRPNEALPVPPGTADGLVPGQALRVRGEAFLNADFSDNTVNGAVVNREIVDLGIVIPDINLIVTDIAAEGSFAGIVERGVNDKIGDYAGVFGGVGATGIAAGLFLNGNFIDPFEDENEYGLFVLVRCGQPGDAAICDSVDP